MRLWLTCFCLEMGLRISLGVKWKMKMKSRWTHKILWSQTLCSLTWISDRVYMQNVTVMGKVREDWQKEHVNACEVRISQCTTNRSIHHLEKYMRNGYPHPHLTLRTDFGVVVQTDRRCCICLFIPLLRLGVWEAGGGEDQHFEEHGMDSSQPALSAMCHQRWGQSRCYVFVIITLIYALIRVCVN